MKSWSKWFERRVELRRRRARLPKIEAFVRGLPEHGPIFPVGGIGPLQPWQVDVFARIATALERRNARRRLQ